MKKKPNRFLLGALTGLLALGLVMAGCDDSTDSGSTNNTQQNGTGGGTNTGGGDNTGGGGNTGGGDIVTPLNKT